MSTGTDPIADTSMLFAGGEPDEDQLPDEVDRGDAAGDDAPVTPPPAEDPPAEDPPAEDPPAEDPPADTGINVPKWRMDSEIAKRKRLETEKTELEKRLEQMQKGQHQQDLDHQRQATAPEPEEQGPSAIDKLNEELSDLDKQYSEAVLDGDIEKANTIRRDIRHKEYSAYQQEAHQTASSQATQATEAQRVQQELNTEAERLVGDYPILHQDHENHDPALVNEIVGLRDYYMGQGEFTPTEALREATEMVAARYQIPKEGGSDKGAAAPPTTPDQQAAAQAAQRKAEVVGRQPPRARGESDATESFQVAGLPEEQFDKLSDEELARARGDIL